MVEIFTHMLDDQLWITIRAEGENIEGNDSQPIPEGQAVCGYTYDELVAAANSPNSLEWPPPE